VRVVFSRIGFVIRFAFAPTKHVANWLGWWPQAVALVMWLLAAIGLVRPKHFHLGIPWSVTLIFFGIALLFFVAAYRLHVTSLLPFPDMKIEALAIFRRDTGGQKLIAIPLRITNREVQKRMSLDLRVRVELAKDPGTDEGLFVLGGEWPNAPLEVKPMHTVRHELHVTWYEHQSPKFSDNPAVPPDNASPFNNQDKLRLDIHDQISGQTVSLRLPGSYETRGTPAQSASP
jgi:hypothetical protein